MKYFVTVGERTVEVEIDGAVVQVEGRRVAAQLERIAGTPEVQVVIDGVKTTVALDSQDGVMVRLVHEGVVRDVIVENERTRHIRMLAGAARPVDAHSSLKAPMPGLVLRVLVAVGDHVVAGQPLLALEAMKMENELKAAGPGQVTAISVSAGDTVEKGRVLMELGGA